MSAGAIFTNDEYNYVVGRINNRLRMLVDSVEEAKDINDVSASTPGVVQAAIACTDASHASLIESKMYAMYKSCSKVPPNTQCSRHRMVLASITWYIVQKMNRDFIEKGRPMTWFAATAQYNLTEEEIAAMLA